MRVSLSITTFSWPGGAPAIAGGLARAAAAADEAGLDTIWVADHLLQSDPTASPDDPMLEAYTTLGFLAAVTRRVRLGTLVTAATTRASALLVKAVTTLDVLSGGRAWLGIGAGYATREAAAMGLPLPPTAERFERLAGTLEIARRMWADDRRPYSGRYERLDGPVGSPRPLTRPHPPVLIGGTGERRTLRLVAEAADACNLFDIPDGGATVRHQIGVLDRHCAEVGRDPAEVERTLTTGLAPGTSAEQLAEHCAELGAVGIEHVVVIPRGRPWDEDGIALLGRAAAQLAAA